MTAEPLILARLSVQRALLTHVTPALRAVSLAVSSLDCQLSLRFIYDLDATENKRALPAIVAAEVCGDWEFPDRVYEEVLMIPAGTAMQHLDWIVYHRCEDAWVNTNTKE
jgi:hypothetical protein